MKNYYDQLCELQIAKSRLKSLTEKKKMYFELTQPGGMAYDSERVQGGASNNMFEVYVEKVEDIDRNISIVRKEIDILEKHLLIMEYELRKMKGTLEKIFCYKYIDGLTVFQICKRTNYSKSEVYRKIKIIDKIIKTGKNGKKYMV